MADRSSNNLTTPRLGTELRGINIKESTGRPSRNLKIENVDEHDDVLFSSSKLIDHLSSNPPLTGKVNELLIVDKLKGGGFEETLGSAPHPDSRQQMFKQSSMVEEMDIIEYLETANNIENEELEQKDLPLQLFYQKSKSVGNAQSQEDNDEVLIQEKLEEEQLFLPHQGGDLLRHYKSSDQLDNSEIT